jgi:hypothetical protein
MLEIPGVLLALALASIYAAVLFLWQGQAFRDLVRYWLASAAGFALGQALGFALSPIPFTLGAVHVLEATAGSVLCLALAHWLKPS